MLIWILFLCIVGMGVLVYAKLCRDIFSPALLFLIAYTVSIGCALTNVDRWNIQMLPVTFAVLLVGAAEFVLIGLAVNRHYDAAGTRTLMPQPEIAAREWTDIRIAGWKCILTFIGCAVCCILLYSHVTAIAGSYGHYDTFPQALNLYKEATSVTLEYALPGWLRQLERIVMICAYIFLYVFLHNMLSEGCGLSGRLRKNWPLLIPPAAYFVNGVLNSDRLQILQLLIAGIVILFLLWVYRTGKKYVSPKTLLILACLACAGLLLFYWSAGRVGRITDKGMFEYITFYCGSSIECLNQFFKSPPVPSDIFGKETFYNLNLKLYSMGLLKLDSFYPIHLEFRWYNGITLGNVYTAYRRWIYDFGFAGAAVLQAIMAFVMSDLYNRVKYRKFRNTGFWMILYGYLSYTVVFHPYDGYLYIQYVSLTFVVTLILLRLFYWFLVETKITFKGGFSMTLGRKWTLEGLHLKKRQEE